MKGSTFIRLLSRLDYGINDNFAEGINKSVQVHMVISLLGRAMRFAVVLCDLGIRSITNMGTIHSKDGVAFKFSGYFRKRRRKL